jgi:predicted MFS family arabinose efflux permease
MNRGSVSDGDEPVVGPTAALRLIGSRDFGPYFAGNALSSSGTWFQNLAGALLVYRLTHSAFMLGVLNVAQFAPVLLLAPWTGLAADRFDRRRVLLATQLLATALSGTLAGLAWGGLAHVWVVILFALGLGVSSAYAAPTSGALVGQLVGRNDLASAVALNSMTYNLARAVGPALAAVTVHTLGIPAAFAINSVSYLALVVGLLVVRARPQERIAREEARLLASLRFVWERPQLLALLLVITAVGFASDPVNTEAPAFAHAFGEVDTKAGYLIGLFGAGAVTAALTVAGRVAGSRMRMAATLTLLGGGIVALSVTPWLSLGYVFLFVAGFGYLASNTSATTRLQLGVAESQRGRIMALWSVAFLGFRPLASLLDGTIAGIFGVRAAGVCLAIPALAAAAVILRLRDRPVGEPIGSRS